MLTPLNRPTYKILGEKIGRENWERKLGEKIGKICSTVPQLRYHTDSMPVNYPNYKILIFDKINKVLSYFNITHTTNLLSVNVFVVKDEENISKITQLISLPP